MKVAINSCYGGFGLSIKAVELYAEKAGFKIFNYTLDTSDGYKNKKNVRVENAERVSMSVYHIKEDIGDEPTSEVLNKAEWFHDRDIERHDPILIEVVEELGEEAGGMCAQLEVIEIPDGTDYCVEEYDGMEHIAESHQTWG